MAASTPTSGLNPSIRLWLVRALFFISFIGCAQAWPWSEQIQEPLQFISPNSNTQNLPIIGIHIGQNLTRAAVIYNKTISLIPFEHGILSMPNIVSFVSNPPLVGHEVTKANATHNVYGIERLMGRRFGEIFVRKVMKEVSFKIVGVNGKVEVEVEEELRGKRHLSRISPEKVMGMLLGRVKKFAVEYVGEVREAVITVPEDWNDAQRVCHTYTLKVLQNGYD
jgi:molecular chaperone DnaK (HSP70)